MDKAEAGRNPQANRMDDARWVIYFSRDRTVLWVDVQDETVSQIDQLANMAVRPPADNFPDGIDAWNGIVEAAFATRMPQYGVLRFPPGRRKYSINAFPDFSLDGHFKGVIEVLNPLDRANSDQYGKRFVDTVLDLTLCGVILYDPQNERVLNVNRRAAQIAGRPVAQLIGLEGRELFGTSGTALLKNIFARIENAGHNMVWGQILFLRTTDGGKEDYFCSLRSLPDSPGPEAREVLCISLEASRSGGDAGDPVPNHKFVLEAMQDGLWEYDVRKASFHYSRNFGDIFGEDGAGDGPGKSVEEWYEAIHPNEAENVFRSWRLLLKKGVRYKAQYRIRARDGSWRWILSTIHAVLNDDKGRPERVLGFHIDITDAMHSEKNLIDAEERLRMIFENVGVGIAVAGMDGILEQANPALALLLGRDRDDLEGRKLSDFAHDEDRPDLVNCLDRLVRGGRREKIAEKRLIRRDGVVVYVDITATLSKNILDGDRRVIVMIEDVTERLQRQSEIQYQATHDTLTGSWNRWVLMERLGQHISLAKRHGQPMAFCLCDLDHFKLVNDTYGHQAGDQVLVQLVKTLLDNVRDTDVVGRYGGEEFGIVFPNTDVEGAAAAVERAGRQLSEVVFRDDNGMPFRVTATFGVVGIDGGSTPKSVLAAADAALYEGKEQGRNRVVRH